MPCSPPRKRWSRSLKEAAKKARRIYLAPDPDREGEAIAWHIAAVLEHATTPSSTASPSTRSPSARCRRRSPSSGQIDQHLVDAQQARRVLDRLMGFKLSPLLWDKVKRGLSAGRVQSVALKMVCDRQDEIDAFVPEEYWILGARAGGRRPAPSSSPGSTRSTAGRRRSRTARRPSGDRERDHRRPLPGRGHRAQGVEAAPVAALHHQSPAAGGGAALRLLASSGPWRIAQGLYEGRVRSASGASSA